MSSHCAWHVRTGDGDQIRSIAPTAICPSDAGEAKTKAPHVLCLCARGGDRGRLAEAEAPSTAAQQAGRSITAALTYPRHVVRKAPGSCRFRSADWTVTRSRLAIRATPTPTGTQLARTDVPKASDQRNATPRLVFRSIGRSIGMDPTSMCGSVTDDPAGRPAVEPIHRSI